MVYRVGLLGGTFDPIHCGHLALAERARDGLGLDKVLFIPAGQPWQKSPVASAEDRLAMAELAVRGRTRFSVSRVELDREGPTYTVDTLREVQAAESDAELWLLLGADAAALLDAWRDPEEVQLLANIAVAARPGTAAHEFSVRGFTVVHLDEMDVSSTDVRARLVRGEPVTGLVPGAVEDYIRERGLYGASRSPVRRP